MTAPVRRRRAALLLSLALACGGLAASQVAGRVREVDSRVGAPVPVLVTARDIASGRSLRAGDLEVRQIPERFVPPDALASAQEAIGSEVAAPIARGSYVTPATLAGRAEHGAPSALRRGERAVEVGVSGAAELARAAGPGARVDVVVSTEEPEGAGRSFVALEDVELLDLRAGGDGSATTADDAHGPASVSAVATLRVTARQAVYLAAAQNFAREVRLLPRPAGDRRRVGRAAVASGGL